MKLKGERGRERPRRKVGQSSKRNLCIDIEIARMWIVSRYTHCMWSLDFSEDARATARNPAVPLLSHRRNLRGKVPEYMDSSLCYTTR